MNIKRQMTPVKEAVKTEDIFLVLTLASLDRKKMLKQMYKIRPRTQDILLCN